MLKTKFQLWRCEQKFPKDTAPYSKLFYINCGYTLFDNVLES